MVTLSRLLRFKACLLTLSLSILIILPRTTSAQEQGRLYLQNFSFKDYEAHQQNWVTVQDRAGVIYVGNNWGILEFDGLNWRLITTDKNSTVIALDIDQNDRIYVGAEDGIGYLQRDQFGQRLSLIHI